MLEAGWLQGILGWVNAHPQWSVALVFLICLLESTFILGLIVPGAFLLFGIGALVSAGGLNVYAILAAGFLGSALGDNLSFWLGRIWRDELKNWGPLRRHAGMIERGEAFFHQHGGKSIMIGRMVGALRPVIPTVAGIAGMSPLSFLAINAFIQIPWLLLYMAPGMLVGASMNLLEEIGTHLLLLLVVTGTSLWALLWLSRRIFIFVSLHAESLTLRVLDWSRHHRRLGLLGPNLADPELPEAPALAGLALLLIFLTWATSFALWQHGDAAPSAMDAVAYHLFQRLHAPGSDTLALVLMQLGNWMVYAPMGGVVLLMLLVRRRWFAALHWMAAVGFGALVALGHDLLVAVPEPIAHYRNTTPHGLLDSFQSGHLIRSTVIYGFLAMLVATGRNPLVRWLCYATAITLTVLIGVARLYLGAQWLSDALLALTVGWIWVGLLTLGYRRHLAKPLPTGILLFVAIGALISALSYQLEHKLSVEREMYLGKAAPDRRLADWPDEDFNALPAYRSDLAEHERYPLNLQWRGDLAEIRAQLLAQGFKDRRDPKLTDVLQWLNAKATFAELALLPQTHDGRREKLLLSYTISNTEGWVLRLWRTHSVSEGQPVWVGTIARYRIKPSLGITRRPRLVGDYQGGLRFLRSRLPLSETERHPAAQASRKWTGDVLILNPGWEP